MAEAVPLSKTDFFSIPLKPAAIPKSEFGLFGFVGFVGICAQMAFDQATKGDVDRLKLLDRRFSFCLRNLEGD